MKSVAKGVGAALLWLVVVLCLGVTIVPRYLDRIYYRGPANAHFDGEHFANPDGADDVLARRSTFLTRYLTGSDGRPAWPDHVTVAQAKPAARVDGQRMVATWIGHASVLVQTAGLNILTDPVWSDSVGPFGIGPGRVAKPGIAFADLPKIDIVLISHNHYDHLDLPTLKRLWQRDRPLIVTSLGNDAVLRSAGIEATALDWGDRISVDGLGKRLIPRAELVEPCPLEPGVPDNVPWSCGVKYEVIANPNHHWGSRWFADRNRALWSSFVLRLPDGNLFFAGDTGFGDGKWADRAALYGPIRLALIPIGAFRFEAGGMGIGSHIGPVDAVEVYRRLGASQAMAIHWGTFRLSYEAYSTPPRMLRAAMACTGQTGFIAAPIGVPQEVPPVAARPAATPISRDGVLRCLDTPAVRALR